MSPAVISITTVAYFIILFTISYIAGRKADNEGFFVGNRKSARVYRCLCHDRFHHFRSHLRFRSGYGTGKSLFLPADGAGIHSRTNYHCICTCSPLLSHESGFHL